MQLAEMAGYAWALPWRTVQTGCLLSLSLGREHASGAGGRYEKVPRINPPTAPGGPPNQQADRGCLGEALFLEDLQVAELGGREEPGDKLTFVL